MDLTSTNHYPGTTGKKLLILLICLLAIMQEIMAQSTMTSFLPTSAISGTTITLTGTNFTGATAVSFGGTPAAYFTVVSPTTITALVGAGSSGNVTVTTAGGTVSLPGFVYIPPPVITALSPAATPVGASITISGANFGATPASNIVYFGAVQATVTSASATSLQVTVPVGASDLPVSVTTNTLTAYSPQPFDATFPGGSSAFITSSFGPAVAIGAPTEPYAITNSDFDGDGKPDLAIDVAYYGDAAVLRNTSTPGNISFAAAASFPTGSNAYSVDAGDIDGDGKPDLVVVNSLAFAFSVLRNTSTVGNISFAPHADFSTGGNQSYTATIADLDGDGKPDLVISFYEAQLAIFHNTSTPGNISFDPAINISLGSWAQKAVVSDLDGDGKPEIVVADGQTLSVFKNQSTKGSISFGSPMNIAVSNYQGSPAIADFDGDGKPDVVTSISGAFALFRNTSSTGSISFAPEMDLKTISPGNIITADLNGDGKPDLSTINSSDSVVVLKNLSTPGTLSFSPAVSYAGIPYALSLTAGDFDGDGKPDLAIAEPNGAISKIYTLLNKVGVPAITSFTPSSGQQRTQIHITGAAFTGTTNVTFGGVPASSFIVEGDTTILATLGQGASGNLVVTTPFGIATAGGFTFTGPTVTSCTPDSAGSGTVVTLTGTNLTNASAVSFGNVPATSFTVVSATKITATVGTGASGTVSVITPVDTALFSGFVYFAQPSVTAMSPAAVDSGKTVVLTGTNLAGIQSVSFGGTPVTAFTVASPDSIYVTLGKGTTGTVQVIGIGGTTTLPGFTYTGTTLTSMLPLDGGPGVTVTLRGTNFRGATAVSFGGASASSFTVVSDSVITAVVAPGAASGTVVVASPQGMAYLPGFVFSNTLPVITSISPSSGAAGATITLTGGNFDPVAANDIVFFGGGVKAQVTSAAANSLTVLVPVGAVYGAVSVTSHGLTAYSNPFNPIFADGGNIDSSTFASKVNWYIGSSPFKVTAADFDGDGKADLAGVVTSGIPNLGSSANGAVAVLHNISQADTIIFASAANFITAAGPYYLTTADLNADGKPDLVISNQGSNSISVLQNTSTPGSLAFASKVDFTTANTPESVTTADLDGDGKPDIAVVDEGSTVISLFLNTTATAGGAVSFAAKQDVTVAPGPGNSSGLIGIAFGDLDGDGRPDMVVCNPPGNRFYVYRNTSKPGAISFAPLVVYTAGVYPEAAYIGDLDGDGKADLVIDNSSSNNVAVYRNLSTPGSIILGTPVTFNAGSGPSDIIFSDVNGDGKPDIAVAASSSDAAAVLQNTSVPGTVSFSAPVLFTVGSLPSYTWPRGIVAGDFDGDGRPDLATANYGGGQETTLSTLRNTLHNPLAPMVSSFTPATAPRGTSITIKGVHFTGATAISFGSTPASSFTVVSDTVIVAVTGNGASGVVAVTTSYGTGSLGGFVFVYPLPVITSFTPVSGRTGDTITLKGANFTNAQSVSLGGVAARSFSVLSDTAALAVVGSGATGDVSITTPGGMDSVAGFTYIPPAPVISALSTLTGGAGTVVTITGSNFSGATAVSFGGTAAASFTVNSATSITAVLGAGATGAISITTPGGTASYGTFTFLYPPHLASFSPASASTGDTLTIKGNYLTNSTAVTLGGVSAASYVVGSDTVIYAVVGSGASGYVTVTSAQGKDSVPGFTFIPPPPAVTTFSPITGGAGTVVTISGTGFMGATAVSFGGTAAISFTVNSATSITAVLGAGATGPVSVTTPNGTASYGTFTFLYPPHLASFSPASASTGDTLTIKGNYLTNSTAVTLGGVSAASYVVVSDTVIHAVVGSGASGYVMVMSAQGKDSVPGFTFIPLPPAVTTFSPVTGGAGTVVTISGTGFMGVTAVSFGGTAAASFTVNSATSITAVLGVGATGSVSVTTPNGTTSYGTFTFLYPPHLASFSPASASTGDTLTIKGNYLTNSTAVTLGGAPAASYVVVSDTVIHAVVGSGASGYVMVMSAQGKDSMSGFTFVSAPPPPPPAVRFQLVSFTGTEIASHALLQWSVMHDSSIAYYVVQYSADSVTFNPIESLKAKQVDSATYVFSDPQHFSGTNYYQLKIEDTAGKVTYSPVIAVRMGGTPATLAVYPNPASESFVVTVPTTTKNSKFELVDMSGNIALTAQVGVGTNQVTINVGTVIRGVYKLIWTDGTNSTYQTVLIMSW